MGNNIKDGIIVEERDSDKDMNNKNNNSNNDLTKYIVVAIVAAMVGVGTLLLIFKLYPDFANKTVTNITKTEKEVTVTDTGIADAVEKIYDSVVIVKNYQRGQLYATGTGFIYEHKDGKYYILTNYHVINGNESIKVALVDGEEVDVNLEGGDKYSDLALLSYETDKDLVVAKIGNNESMRVGDTVFAIGAPLDSSVYSWSVTRGVLSGKDRQVEVSTSNAMSGDWIMTVLQTDAAINSGNSGGPLCNSNGEVIGITNMKLASTGVEGMGFAIPIEEAVSYANKVINGESTKRPYLGVSMDVANSYYASYYGFDKDIEGVVVVEVVNGSPADKAGIKAGDVITELGGEKIADVASLRVALYKYNAGDKVEIKVVRGSKENTVTATLTEGN